MKISNAIFGSILLKGNVITKRADRNAVLQSKSKENPLREIEFLQEIYSLGFHDNIVKCLDWGIGNKYIDICFEYAEKGDLFNYISGKGKLSSTQTMLFFSQLVDGVKFLHENDFVHCDISLENCFVFSDELVKLGDFGQAGKNQIFYLESLHDVPSKMSYRAPEVQLKKRFEGKPIDVWSLGIVLYSMTIGMMLFRQIGSRRFAFFRDNGLEALIERDGIRHMFTYEIFNHLQQMIVLDPDERIKIENIF
jgi:5'-AMP-activated protein kinase catalytic alpha subunit